MSVINSTPFELGARRGSNRISQSSDDWARWLGLISSADCPTKRFIIDQLTGDVREITVSSGMWQYLKMEARRRGMSVLAMYDLEQQALAEIESLCITDEFLNYVTQHANPAQKAGH